VSQDVLASASVFVPRFTDFAAISGLQMNLGKTVFVPLGDVPVEAFRTQLEGQFPGCGAAGIRT
jgi:hypothetical protein